MNITKDRFFTVAVFLVLSLLFVLGAGLISPAKASSVIFDDDSGVYDPVLDTFTFDILVGDIGPLDNLDAWNLEFNITRQTDPGDPFSFSTDTKADIITKPSYVFAGNSSDWQFIITGGPAAYNAFAGDLTVDGLGTSNPEDLLLATLILNNVKAGDIFDVEIIAANSFFLDSDGDLDSIVSGLVEVQVVPIPGALWLLGSGLVCLIGLRRKNQKH